MNLTDCGKCSPRDDAPGCCRNATPAPVAADTLTEDEWLDLAERHASKDWNSDGYLNAVKALCQDFVRTASPARAAEPQERARWQEIERRWHLQKSSQSKMLLEALDLDGYVTENLADIVDRAIDAHKAQG